MIRAKHGINLFVMALLTVLHVGAAHSLTPANHWSKQFGAPADPVNDGGYSVATDAFGNVLVTGYFRGVVNFGGGNLASAGGTDIFVAKYNSLGVYQWSLRFGGTSDDAGQCVAADDAGNVLVTGSFAGTANFGGGNLVSAGVTDIFIAKYNASGVHQWSQRFGSTFTDVGFGIVTAPGGALVYVTGSFMGTVNFGGGNLVSVTNSKDIFVAAYGSTGLHLWSQRFGDISFDTGYAIATDTNASAIVTGSFAGTVSFGGSALTGAGFLDIFVAKYSSGGGHLWSKRFGSTSDDEGRWIATDASDNVVVTGSFAGIVNFGGVNQVSAGNKDIFFAKYNSAGAHQWSQRAGGAGDDTGQSIDTDASGNVYATGFFTGTADFGSTNLVSGGLEDIFVARFNAAGAYRYLYRFGSIGSSTSDKGFAIAADATGHLVASGYFAGTVDFGSGNLSTAAPAQDAFLARYASQPSEPIISAISDIGNDQGRQVKIVFDRSGRDDAAMLSPVIRYEAYRRIDAPPSLLMSTDPSDLSRRQLLDLGWIQVGAVDGHGKSEYSMDVPTIGDSTVALGQYRSTFFVRGATSNSFAFFDSPPDSGYSLDNLAPGVPLNFVYDAGDLSWSESTAADFDFFTVYGSNTDNFGAATVVDYSIATSMDVSASPYAYYYVIATDFSGNEGKPAKVNSLTGAGGTPKNYVLSVSNYPNPFNPRTTVSYTIPSRGSVTVSVYDARGAHVATLFSGERAAGAYSVDWDGRTDGAAVAASGVYFARIEHASGTRSKKMVLLK